LGVGCVVDVGANRGDFVRAIRKFGFAGRVVCFEPDPNVRRQLDSAMRADPDALVRDEALGAEEAEASLYLAEDPVFSSLLQVTRQAVSHAPAAAPIGRQAVHVKRLDSIWNELGAGDRHVGVKIDTQGSDLRVIEGMDKVLDRVDVLLCELSMRSLYDEQPSGREIIDRLQARGFDLVSLWPVYADPRSHALVDVDGLFVNRSAIDRERTEGGAP
jgi:FkbM family methyltransferase